MANTSNQKPFAELIRGAAAAHSADLEARKALAVELGPHLGAPPDRFEVACIRTATAAECGGVVFCSRALDDPDDPLTFLALAFVGFDGSLNLRVEAYLPNGRRELRVPEQEIANPRPRREREREWGE